MQTLLDYLAGCKSNAWRDRHVYSADYAMTQPIEGYESRFQKAVEECEIVGKLIEIVEEKMTTQCNGCILQEKQGEIKNLISFFKEVDEYINAE